MFKVLNHIPAIIIIIIEILGIIIETECLANQLHLKEWNTLVSFEKFCIVGNKLSYNALSEFKMT